MLYDKHTINCRSSPVRTLRVFTFFFCHFPRDARSLMPCQCLALFARQARWSVRTSWRASRARACRSTGSRSSADTSSSSSTWRSRRRAGRRWVTSPASRRACPPASRSTCPPTPTPANWRALSRTSVAGGADGCTRTTTTTMRRPAGRGGCSVPTSRGRCGRRGGSLHGGGVYVCVCVCVGS